MRGILLFLPDELIILLIVGGGFAMIFGARRLGGSLIVMAIALAVLPGILAPLFDMLPGYLLVVLLLFFLVSTVFSGLRWLSSLIIGGRATDNMVGSLAADVVKATFLGTLRLCGSAFRGVWRGLSWLLRI